MDYNGACQSVENSLDANRDNGMRFKMAGMMCVPASRRSAVQMR